jgi:hypothetical protein
VKNCEHVGEDTKLAHSTVFFVTGSRSSASSCRYFVVIISATSLLCMHTHASFYGLRVIQPFTQPGNTNNNAPDALQCPPTDSVPHGAIPSAFCPSPTAVRFMPLRFRLLLIRIGAGTALPPRLAGPALTGVVVVVVPVAAVVPVRVAVLPAAGFRVGIRVGGGRRRFVARFVHPARAVVDAADWPAR